MKPIVICLGLLAAGVLGQRSALADFTWLDTAAEVKVALSDAAAKAAFRFENRSDAAIEITEIRSSCGCAVATSDKKKFAPGEAGKIDVTVQVGLATGTVEREVVVKTSASTGAGQVLRVRVVIPTVCTLAPERVQWIIGKDAAAKKVVVTALDGFCLRPVAATCRHSAIEASCQGSADGKGIEVSICPKEMGGSCFTEVVLAVDVTFGTTIVRKEVRVPVTIDYDL